MVCRLGLLVALLSASTAEAQGLRPSAVGIDFGTVALHSQQEQSLWLHNPTLRPVRMVETDSDCVCLTSKVSDVIPPLGVAEWWVTLRTCDFVGEARRAVWLRTSEGTQIRLPVRYQVVPALYTEPEFASLGLLAGESAVVEVMIRTSEDGPVYILEGRCLDDAVEVDVLDRVVRADHPARIRIRAPASLPAEPLRTQVVLLTTSAEVPELRVPVFGEPGTGIACNLHEINFKEISVGSSRSFEVRLALAAGTTVQSVRTNHEALDVPRIERLDHAIVLTVVTNPRLPLGSFQGQLLLETQGSQSRIVRLPFRGRVVLNQASGPPEPGVVQAAGQAMIP